MEYKFPAHNLPRNNYNSITKKFPNTYSTLEVPSDFVFHKKKPIFMTDFESNDNYLTQRERDLKVAGMRIFATIMLNAWRKRSEEVKHLMKSIEELKSSSLKVKNQLHVFNTLFRVEQKRNDELNCQLKHSLDTTNQAKSSCESLTTSVISLKTDKALLEQDLQNKHKEIDALNTMLMQTKSDLFRTMVDQRSLQTCLCKEQRNVQYLENQKNKLINELCELSTENRVMEEKYCRELDKKSQELNECKDIISNLHERLCDLRRKETQLEEFKVNDMRMRSEVTTLRNHAKMLQLTLNNSLGNRLRTYWNQWMHYQRTTLEVTHMIAYYLLPATPPPTSKFTFTNQSTY